jgi:prevent-host-death family protein
MTVNVSYARTHLSRLVRLAARGEVITIVRRGKPVAKLVAIEKDAKLSSGKVQKARVPTKRNRR